MKSIMPPGIDPSIFPPSETLLARASELVDSETVNADVAYISAFFPSVD